ncbi:hypothetical protein QTP70_021217 [Hemibagrus guttatus]|uniref:Murine leukemia virus integrase C-terminal domain-containing protein n=1 Tax=Hemibagrus guttatus TaxID=175788 RepID=A0AAE0V239_9TELE|nr:hypothetical protein QTP70_021217 [Hemibagrus guttatus]
MPPHFRRRRMFPARFSSSSSSSPGLAPPLFPWGMSLHFWFSVEDAASLLIGRGGYRPHLPPSLTSGVFGPAGLKTSLGSPAQWWTLLGSPARLWTSLGTLWPYHRAHHSPHLPRRVPRSPHLSLRVPRSFLGLRWAKDSSRLWGRVKGATEGRTSEINKVLRIVQPGDWVYVKVFKRKWNEPRRVRPLKVVLATPTALKVEGKNAWFHLNHLSQAQWGNARHFKIRCYENSIGGDEVRPPLHHDHQSSKSVYNVCRPMLHMHSHAHWARRRGSRRAKP